MPPKRKREKEPSLLDDLVKWRTSLVRAFKTAKGFERQRLSKRIREIQHPPKTTGSKGNNPKGNNKPQVSSKLPQNEDDAAAKIARLEREVAVLKSIDLHQLAQQTLCSALLKVKGIAESGDKTIDGEVKQGVEEGRKVVEGLDEDMRAALHNVSSGLCNRKQVRDVLQEAVMGTCIRLRVSMPDKRKGKKGEKKPVGEKGVKHEDADGDEEQVAKKAKLDGEKKESVKNEGEKELVLLKRKRQDPEDGEEVDGVLSGSDGEEDGEEEDVFEGFSDEEAEEKAIARYDNLLAASSDESGSDDGEEADSEENEEDDEEEEGDEGAKLGGDDEVDERMISRYMKLLAASSDEDSDAEGGSDDEEEELVALLRARAGSMKKKRVTDDDISLSEGNEEDGEGRDVGADLDREFSGEESGEGYDYREDISGGSEDEEQDEQASEDGEEEEEEEEEQEESSDSDAPAPKKAKLSSAAIKATKSGTSAFLPTLMGGYISNSESEASDLDIAPTLKKNRRGQRARQAIWEKKYGAGAKHHSKPKSNSRDDGWDLRRGAVSTGDGGGGNGEEKAGPWKKGIKNPFEKKVLSVDEGLHPERMRAIEGGGNMVGKRKKNVDRAGEQGPSRGGFGDADAGGKRGYAQPSNGGNNGYHGPPPAPAKPLPVKKRDDEGVLHPSWAAAKKAKEEAGKIEFKGKKVTFD